MSLPEFNSFSLQDGNYITEKVEFRGSPNRQVETEKITGRSGVKILGAEFAERIIKIIGHIIGTSVSDLQSKIDNLNSNVVGVDEKDLEIEAGRTYTATCRSAVIPDPQYSHSYVPFDLEFYCADPFAYGDTLTSVITVPSGTSSATYNLTISGTAYARPSFVYENVGSSGDTTTSGYRIDHADTGHYVSISGTVTDQTFDYGSSVTLNYDTQTATVDTSTRDYTGQFLTRWEPGVNEFTVTFAGNTEGGDLTITYKPRYL